MLSSSSSAPAHWAWSRRRSKQSHAQLQLHDPTVHNTHVPVAMLQLLESITAGRSQRRSPVL